MKVLQILSLIFGLFFVVHSQNIAEKSAETILSGTVYDDVGAHIPNAVIKIVGSDKKEFVTKANEDGTFEIKLFPGIYSIQIESVELQGFQTFKLEKYRIAPSDKGKMNFDIVLEALETEPCGYGGAGIGCMTAEPITERSEIKISDKILQIPLEKLPEGKNTTKRKN